SLYLGVIASMYLDDETNSPRLPPQTNAADAIFSFQREAFAAKSTDAITKKLMKHERLALYRLDTTQPSVRVRLDIVPESERRARLASLRIGGEEVLTLAQAKPELRLHDLLGGATRASGRAIVKLACDLFSVPFDQVAPITSFDSDFLLEETVGFKEP